MIFMRRGGAAVVGLLLLLPALVWADAAPDYNPRRRETKHIDLMSACELGRVEEARRLLKSGANPTWEIPDGYQDSGRKPAVLLAAAEGQVQIIRLLLDQRPQLVATHGSDMLEEAIREMVSVIHRDKLESYVTIIKLLLERKVSLAPPPSDGPLFVAARCRNLAALKLLLDAGGAVNGPRSYKGGTLLCTAACSGDVAVMRELLRRGADLSPGTSYQEQPLYSAADCGNDDNIDYLLEQKLDVNRATSDGDTPLMAAAAQGHPRVVRRLLAAGADAKRKNNKGQTALLLAKEAQSSINRRPDYLEIIGLLEPISREQPVVSPVQPAVPPSRR